MKFKIRGKHKEINLITLKQNEDGIVALICGIISAVSFLALILVSFLNGGRSNPGIGLVGLVSMIFSVVGLIYGTVNLKTVDRPFGFVKVGFFMNALFVLAWVLVLVFGLYN